MKRQEGFSLAEVLIGLAVAIVAAVVLMGAYNAVINRVGTAGVTSHFRTIHQGVESYINEQTSKATKRFPDASNFDEDGGMTNFIDSRIFDSEADPWKRKYHFAVSPMTKPTGSQDNKFPGGIQWMMVWSEGPTPDIADEAGILEYHGGFPNNMFTGPVRIAPDGAITGVNDTMSVNNKSGMGVSEETPHVDNPYALLQLNENRTVTVIDQNLRNE